MRNLLIGIFCSMCLVTSCKKEGNTNPSSGGTKDTVLPYNMRQMNGNHTWSGKKYFLNHDTSTWQLFQDSSTITFTNNIVVLDSDRIVLNQSYFLSNETLGRLFVDTVSKVIVFKGGLDPPGHTYMAFRDSLAYFYLNNTFYWYSGFIENINSAHAILQSP